MLIIYRSILKELLVSFLLSILFLNSALMMEKLLKLSRVIAGVGASLADMAEIILYLQPQVLTFTIPMALLLSTLLTYGRMNADNELVILKISGMSFRSISRPVLYLGLVCLLSGIAMGFYLSPKASSLLREKMSDMLTRRAAMTIEEGVFNTAFKGITILVREKPAPERLSGIFIFDERKKGEERIIVAEEGLLIPEDDSISFSLTKGQVYIMDKKAVTEISFGKYFFKLNLTVETGDRKKHELTPLELIKAARESPDRRISMLLELNRRLSMPAICLIVIFLGPSLSLMAGKAGRLGGLTIGLVVFAVYYVGLIYGENSVRAGNLPVMVGSWLPFAVLGMISLWIFERVNRK